MSGQEKEKVEERLPRAEEIIPKISELYDLKRVIESRIQNYEDVIRLLNEEAKAAQEKIFAKDLVAQLDPKTPDNERAWSWLEGKLREIDSVSGMIETIQFYPPGVQVIFKPIADEKTIAEVQRLLSWKALNQNKDEVAAKT